MFSASPLFELASIVAKQINPEQIPVPYSCVFQPRIVPLFDPNHLYFGQLISGGRVASLAIQSPVSVLALGYFANDSGSLIADGVYLFDTILESGAPIIFIGYRIPVNR